MLLTVLNLRSLAGWGRVLGLLLGLLLAGSTAAGPAPLPPDRSTPLRLRQPDTERLDDLRGQRDFRYVEADVRHEQSPAGLYWEQLRRRFFEWLGSQSYDGFWRWIFYTVLVVALVYAVLRLAQVDLTGLFGRVSGTTALVYDTQTEDINAPDLGARLAEAEAAGDFRLATRLGYLQLLKSLTDHELIRWQPDKTNHAYLTELPPNSLLQRHFGEVTRQFEFVWYGELLLSASLYAHVRAGRRALQQLATNGRAV